MNKENTIGLLVVHGLGDQEPGETIEKLVKGLSRVYGDELEIERDDSELPIELRLNEKKVKLYEVFWADLLSGDNVKNTFNWTEFQALAWLPWLNQKAGLLPGQHYKKFMSLIWTILLIPISGLMWIAYKGANFTSKKNKYSKVDRVIDDVVGDLTNYMASVGEIRFEGSREKLVNVAHKIHKRFYTQLSNASNECDKVQILAHSLGTVITYHALTGLLLQIDENSEDKNGIRPINKLSRLYTIGSPLGKIRFFWPTTIKTDLINDIVVKQDKTLLLTTSSTETSSFKWDNFFHKYDVISGKLKRFTHWNNLTLHSLKGGGGIIRSHVIYERSPQFLEVITNGLFGEARLLKVGAWGRFLDRVFTGMEFIILPSLFTILSLIGLAVVSYAFLFTGAFFSDLVAENYGRDTGDVLGIVFVGVMIIALVGAWYFNTKKVAKDLHEKWTYK